MNASAAIIIPAPILTTMGEAEFGEIDLIEDRATAKALLSKVADLCTEALHAAVCPAEVLDIPSGFRFELGTTKERGTEDEPGQVVDWQEGVDIVRADLDDGRTVYGVLLLTVQRVTDIRARESKTEIATCEVIVTVAVDGSDWRIGAEAIRSALQAELQDCVSDVLGPAALDYF